MSRKITLIVAVVLFAAALFLNSCKSYDVASRYNSQYIKTSTGKVSAEVPEVFELGYAMLALTDLAQQDTTIINHNTPYYQDLIARFGKYKNHKGVMRLNADLSRNPKRIKNYLDGLYALQVKYNRVSLKSNYRIDLNKVDFKGYALLLQNFYKQTNFHEFYTQHEDLYHEMVQNANSLFTFAEVQKSLNTNVKGYQIILSPLTKAYAGTMEIKGRGYSECIIFPPLATAQGTRYMMSDMMALNKPTE
ncbi:DUF4932 domain-containing protein [Mucilaginibacter robiniae]|uniref:DUF4932 domain-containing protein n=1 Tax=Mucilaginibacter robiniae TaxID=2728022 RepID=A0A7L5DYF0_9SPHI|nr:DUF4932 domain-containing protein [Mucilaginibacter robiniae]QJD95801.1 DUF4932 domain-containing protein [Mucilaginibacter robiniae]